MKSFRLAVKNDEKKLLGYWYVRDDINCYAVTYRHPISREFKYFATDKAEDAVKYFYTTYLKYLDALVAQLEHAIKVLPSDEERRPGFRPHHFRNIRRELVSRRAALICRSRERYTEAVLVLRERGWPPVPPPPCFHVDINHAATSSRSHTL